VGGAREPDLVGRSSDGDLIEISRRELERLMGPLGPARFTRVFRHERASPQPVIGHLARVERIRARLASLPGLHLAGAGYDGVGIPDCIRQGRAAARAITGELRALHA
jgi:oxygen-dependent protoporphyrinogen oxidase